MKTLEKFYNEEIKVNGMPDFKDLSESVLKNMKKSMSFSIFNAKDVFRKSKLKWQIFRFVTFAILGSISLFLFYAVVVGFIQIFGW